MAHAICDIRVTASLTLVPGKKNWSSDRHFQGTLKSLLLEGAVSREKVLQFLTLCLSLFALLCVGGQNCGSFLTSHGAVFCKKTLKHPSSSK